MTKILMTPHQVRISLYINQVQFREIAFRLTSRNYQTSVEDLMRGETQII